MVYGATIVLFFFEKYIKQINAPCGQNRGFLGVTNQNGTLYNVIKPNKHDGKSLEKFLYHTVVPEKEKQ
jgi:hypothetical protein